MECLIVKQKTCLTKQSVSVVTSDDGKHLSEMDTKYFAQPGIYILLKNIWPNESYWRSWTTSKETAKKIAGVLDVIFWWVRISADKANPSNYRPVSLTCITCKLMEHIVCSQIGSRLDCNNIRHANKYGFRKGVSCETQVVDTTHGLVYSINEKDANICHISGLQ